VVNPLPEPVLEVHVGSQACDLPASCVVKIDRMPQLAPAPGLPAVILGVASIDGQVMPVVDLGRLLGLAPHAPSNSRPMNTCEFRSRHTEQSQIVVVSHRKGILALTVDQAWRVCTDHQGGGGKQRIDVADLVARLAQHQHSLSRPSRAPPMAFGAALAPRIAMRVQSARGAESPALAVATGGKLHYLSLANVVAVLDAPPIVAVPDPNPALVGIVFQVGRAIPVVRLDQLLGVRQATSVASEAVVVLKTGNGTCAVAVNKVIGLASGIDPERRLDPAMLLRTFVEGDASVGHPHAPRLQAHQDPQYLLLEIADQLCALKLNEVARVQDRCTIVPIPSHWANAFGLANVEGSLLPVLNAAAILGLGSGDPEPGGYVVVTDANVGKFVIPVRRLMRIVALADAQLRAVGEDTLLSGVGAFGGRTVWALSAALLAGRAGWRRNAA
jgi:chemotaxis signal transduction protein